MNKRVKGWVDDSEVILVEHGRFNTYVEEIPADAVRGEKDVFTSGEIGGPDYGCIAIKLPASLIGKRVEYIIIPVED